jgi:hypothetical protein
LTEKLARAAVLTLLAHQTRSGAIYSATRPKNLELFWDFLLGKINFTYEKTHRAAGI